MPHLHGQLRPRELFIFIITQILLVELQQIVVPQLFHVHPVPLVPVVRAELPTPLVILQILFVPVTPTLIVIPPQFLHWVRMVFMVVFSQLQILLFII
jgi:hypothetical protein